MLTLLQPSFGRSEFDEAECIGQADGVELVEAIYSFDRAKG